MSEPPKSRLLMAKAFAYTRALSNMTEKERMATASETLAQDYDDLVSHAGDFVAWIGFVPPRTTRWPNDNGVRETLGEIYVFCEQIYQMLSLVVEEEEEKSR